MSATALLVLSWVTDRWHVVVLCITKYRGQLSLPPSAGEETSAGQRSSDGVLLIKR